MRLFRIFRIYLSLIPRTQALLAGQGLLPAQSVPLGTGAQQGKCLIILTYSEICITEADTRLKAWFILNYQSVLKLWLLLSQITPRSSRSVITSVQGSSLWEICTIPTCHLPHLPCDQRPTLLKTDQQFSFFLCSFAFVVDWMRLLPPCWRCICPRLGYVTL